MVTTSPHRQKQAGAFLNRIAGSLLPVCLQLTVREEMALAPIWCRSHVVIVKRMSMVRMLEEIVDG